MRPLVDFHCHLDLYPDHAEAVARCEREGVFTLAVTTTPKAWPRNQELAAATRHVRAALGLHPQLVAERSHEIALWKELLPRTRYVGEVGLDAGPTVLPFVRPAEGGFRRGSYLLRRSLRQDPNRTQRSRDEDRARHDREASAADARSGGVALVHRDGGRNQTRCRSRLLFLGQRRDARKRKPGRREPRIPVGSCPHRDRWPVHANRFCPSEPSDVWQAVEGLASLHCLETVEVGRRIGANLKSLLDEVS